MANFDARIKVLLDAQQAYKEIAKIEKRIAGIQDTRTQTQARQLIDSQKKQVKQADAALQKQLALTSATELYARRLQQLDRAGANQTKRTSEQVAAVKRVVDAQGDNVNVLNKANTLLGRILERTREINRGQLADDAITRRVRAYRKELDLLKQIGFTDGELRKATEKNAQLAEQSARREFDLAKRTEASLKQQINLLKAKVTEYDRLGRQARSISSPIGGRADQPGSPASILANAARSPVRGGAGFPGSPAYLKLQQAEAKKTEAALRRVATAAVRSPIRGGINFPGSPNYLKEQARLAKKAKTEFEKLNNEVIRNAVSSPVRGGANFPGSPDFLKQQATAAKNRRKQGFGQAEKLLTGAGFPLLFGGGPGAVAGGALGGVFDALAGTTFGFSIALGALGQALDGALQGATEVGQALNPLTLDLEKLAGAAGLAGTSTETLLKQVEEVRGAFVAAELAGEQLAVIIGQDGVDNLRALGESAANLGNEASKAFTALSAALAPALTAVNNFLADNIQRSRLLSRGSGDFRDDEQIQGIRQRFQNRELGEIETEDLIIKRVRELEAAEKKAADTRLRSTVNAARAAEDVVRIKESELVISQLNNDILNDRVFQEEENILRIKAATEEKKLYLQFAKDEITLAVLRNKLEANNLELQKALKDLQGDRDDAQARKDAEAARQAAAAERERLQILSKRYQLENQIAQTVLRQNQEIIRGVEAQTGPLAAARLEQQNQSLVLEQRLLEIERQRDLASQQKNANVQLINTLAQKQIELANEEYNTARLITDQKIRQIEAEREITRIQSERGVNAVSRDLGRQQEDISTSLSAVGNSDLQQQLELQIRQQRRYDDALRGSAELIEELRIRRKGESEEQQAITDQQIRNEQKKIDIYKQQLPVLNELEQQQLKFNQVYAKVKPIADAVAGSLISGIRGVIEGTKTAEEAFKDFLNTIVDILLKTAAEMIATYIAIGIARQFAGLGGGGGAGDAVGVAKAIAGPFPGREVGGRTMANMPYVVGEKGAELFVPGKTGTIVPADVFEATRQAISGNGPEGGDSDAFAQNSVALGNTATITKENSLVREMGMRENEPIDIRYESTVINNVSYVSEEQFQKGLKTAVAQSKSAVFSDLKNKPSARAGIGMR